MSGDHSIIFLSSSPELPSLATLIAKRPKKPNLRAGTTAAPILDDAPATFTTATSVRRGSQREADTVFGEASLPKHGPASAAKPPVSIPADLSPPLPPSKLPADVSKTRPRGSKAAGTTRRKKVDTAAAIETGDDSVIEVPPPALAAVEAKPARKRRVAKTTTDGQTTLPKGRVTKPSAKRKVSAKKTESVSRHFSKEPSPPKESPEARPNPVEDTPLDLEPATRRRADWTPPPETILPVADSSAVKEMSSTAVAFSDVSGGLFENLQETFGRKDEQAGGERPITTDVLGKRKLLQMVATTTISETTSKSTTPEVSPAKSKAPKKKPRTITDLAMEAYRVAEEPEAPKQDSIVGYLDGHGAAPDKVGGQTAAKKPAKPRAPRKKPEPKKPILLSPASAMRQVSHQNFVFGTASQLATEEDPDLLRALHEAMKASNLPESDPFGSSSPVATNLTLRRRGNKLWAAGARDDDGDLLDLELIDMTESLPRPIPLPVPPEESPPELPKERAREATPPRGSQHVPIELSSDLPSFDQSPRPKSHFFITQAQEELRAATQPTTPAASSRLAIPDPGSVTVDFDLEPPPSNQEHNMILSQSQSMASPQPKAATKAKAKVPAKRAPPKAKAKPKEDKVAEEPELEASGQLTTMGPPPPKYELFTDAQLTKEVAAFGFKTIKKRTTMIELLQQCWAHKHKTAYPASSVTSAAAPSSNLAPPPASPKPRGRPKKVAAATESADSVEPAGPAKKPRGRPRKDATTASPSNATATKTKVTSAQVVKAAAALPASEPPAPATPKRRKAPAKSVVEIPDSDDSDSDPFASSPIMSPEPQEDVFSSPNRGDLEVSITEDTEMSLMAGTPTSREMEVFDYITKAIKTEPPTSDVTDPSWHEKMLMYDPIILEDLAAWLNSGELDRVGYDGEVAASEVKSWCESKSICCLWRVSLKGKERKRL